MSLGVSAVAGMFSLASSHYTTIWWPRTDGRSELRPSTDTPAYDTLHTLPLVTCLLRRLQAQTLPDATPPIGKIYPFTKTAVTFEPVAWRGVAAT